MGWGIRDAAVSSASSAHLTAPLCSVEKGYLPGACAPPSASPSGFAIAEAKQSQLTLRNPLHLLSENSFKQCLHGKENVGHWS